MLKKTLLSAGITVFALSAFNSYASEADLEKRVDSLEKRVASLEKTLDRITRKEQRIENQKKLIAKARERMFADLKVYSREQLGDIEKLYQIANRKWKSKEAKESLETLVSKYKKANRTGCAMLYLGQMSQGKQQEEYLKKAVSDFSDCMYGDGVQVGALARFKLALYYLNNGKQEEAEKLFAELRKKYPNSIDHRGNHLIDQIPSKALKK